MTTTSATCPFDPAASFANPFDADARPIVFTGAMDYHANVDGVRWFVHEVMPAVRSREPDAVFAIVGSNPTPVVRALAIQPGVIVTGRVPDVRPYLAHADVVVAPLRLARGVQNKVLEAMSMGLPVVCTPQAAQGLGAAPVGVRVPADADATVAAVGEPLADPARARAIGREAAAWVRAHCRNYRPGFTQVGTIRFADCRFQARAGFGC